MTSAALPSGTGLQTCDGPRVYSWRLLLHRTFAVKSSADFNSSIEACNHNENEPHYGTDCTWIQPTSHWPI